MEPRNDDDAVVELLDTVVERGVVLDADLVIAVADVPLVGVSLRAALAGMTTMTEHGLLEDWDRAWRTEADSSLRTDQSEAENTPENL